MELNAYYKIRSGVQQNAHRADDHAVDSMRRALHAALLATGAFHTVEVDATGDADRMVIAIVKFAPGADVDEMGQQLAGVWEREIGYAFWSAHMMLTSQGQVELLGATRSGDRGHYLTVHILAQASEIPAQREPRAVIEPAPGTEVPMPKQSRAIRRIFARQAAAFA